MLRFATAQSGESGAGVSTALPNRLAGTQAFIGQLLPSDLRELADATTVMAWVHEAVLELDWHNPLVLDYLRQHPEYRPQVLLRVLAYVYVTSMQSSDAIASACQGERALFLVSEGKPPFAQELLRFRRKNRRLLERVLAGVFARALRHGQLGVPPVEVASDELVTLARERLDLARHMDLLDE